MSVRQMQGEGVKVETLPAKAIASKKPPNKKKGREVVCGNFAEERDEVNVSVGRVCAMTVRGLLHTAACKHWGVGSTDVTGAFLQAPRRSKATVTIVQPPRLLQQLGIVNATERWKVCCALYGLVESPGDWAQHRDKGLEVIEWKDKYKGMRFWLERMPEQHL